MGIHRLLKNTFVQNVYLNSTDSYNVQESSREDLQLSERLEVVRMRFHQLVGINHTENSVSYLILCRLRL